MTYPIDTSIPIPARDLSATVNYKLLPLDTLAIGASFLIRAEEFGGRSVHSIAKNVRQRAKRRGIRVRTQVRHQAKHGESGLRTWRTP